MKKIFLLLFANCLLINTVWAQDKTGQGADTAERTNRFLPLHATGLDSVRYQQILSYLTEASHKPIAGDKQVFILDARALEPGYCDVTACQDDGCRKDWIKQFVKRLGGKRKVDVFIVDTRREQVAGADSVSRRWGIPYCRISVSRMIRTFYRNYVPGCFGIIVLNTNRKYVSSYDNPRDVGINTKSLMDSILDFYNRFCKESK
nr:hypothetical protein [uncultured Mucilaginibacter sp.]